MLQLYRLQLKQQLQLHVIIIIMNNNMNAMNWKHIYSFHAHCLYTCIAHAFLQNLTHTTSYSTCTRCGRLVYSMNEECEQQISNLQNRIFLKMTDVVFVCMVYMCIHFQQHKQALNKIKMADHTFLFSQNGVMMK